VRRSCHRLCRRRFAITRAVAEGVTVTSSLVDSQLERLRWYGGESRGKAHEKGWEHELSLLPRHSAGPNGGTGGKRWLRVNLYGSRKWWGKTTDRQAVDAGFWLFTAAQAGAVGRADRTSENFGCSFEGGGTRCNCECSRPGQRRRTCRQMRTDHSGRRLRYDAAPWFHTLGPRFVLRVSTSVYLCQ
jgi:hypothetical protein